MDFIFTWDDDPVQHEPFVVCERCGEKVCSAEEGDSLEIIVACARDHECQEER